MRAASRWPGLSPARGGLDEVPVAVQVRDGLVNLVKRMAPARVREGERAQCVGREHRAPLLQVLHRTAHHRERGRRVRVRGPGGGAGAPAGGVAAARGPELAGTGPPRGAQHPPVRLGLAPTGVERGLLRTGRSVGPAPAAEVGEQLPASRGERIEHGARVAGNLEARHLSDQRGDGGVAEALQPDSELMAVDRADEESGALHRGELRAAPLPCPVARHVGDDRVGVELGVQVAARHVAEGGRRQAVGPDPRAAPGRGLMAPGLEQLRLDEVERRAHRLVVCAHHPRAGAPRRVDERLQRDGLGRREGHVYPGAVLVRPVAHPAEPDARARHVAREQRLEALGPHRAAKPERGGELPVPGARPAVLGVAPRVVPVGLEVVHRRGRRAQPDHGRDHRRYSPAAGSNSSAGGAGARPPLGYTGTVTARGGVTTMRQLTLRWSTTALPAQLASTAPAAHPRRRRPLGPARPSPPPVPAAPQAGRGRRSRRARAPSADRDASRLRTPWSPLTDWPFLGRPREPLVTYSVVGRPPLWCFLLRSRPWTVASGSRLRARC